jgi:hypothetical protein
LLLLLDRLSLLLDAAPHFVRAGRKLRRQIIGELPVKVGHGPPPRVHLRHGLGSMVENGPAIRYVPQGTQEKGWVARSAAGFRPRSARF